LWDRPQALTAIADMLLLFAGVALCYAALLFALRMPVFPLRQVVVAGELQHVNPAQLEFAARRSLTGNFFTVDLARVRTEFEQQPWVRRASVRRLWPGGIAVEIEEHRAAARWHSRASGETSLVNSKGEVFAVTPTAAHAALPLLSGPPGSAPLMLWRYQQFAGLLSPLALAPVDVGLSSRLAWRVRLTDGLLLELGRETAKLPLEERLARFVAVYAAIKARLTVPIEVIDMRYSNGLALRPGKDKSKT